MITTGTFYQDIKAIIKLALTDRVVRGNNNIPAYEVINQHRNEVEMTGKPAIFFYELIPGEEQHPSSRKITIETLFTVGIKTRIKDVHFDRQVSALLQMFSKTGWAKIPYNFTYNTTAVHSLADIGVTGVSRGQITEFRDFNDTTKPYIAEFTATLNFSFNYNEIN